MTDQVPSQFPDSLGLIGAGHGKVVLPGPEIQNTWNLRIRDYEDRTFRWHLVTGLEPTPDGLGYQFVEPESYRLEITPDLGWRETEAMFVPYEPGTGTGNGRLRVFRDLKLNIDLTDQGDETVTFQAPLDDMKRILAPGYDLYLWRVVAVAPSGHEGHPSGVQSFRGRVIVPSVSWTVQGPQGPLSGLTAPLQGTRQANVSKIEINDTDAWTSYPSADTWQAEVPLSGGRNVFHVRAFDGQGNGSEYRTVEVEVTNKALTTDAYFNTFDDFGFLMGLPRLPGERNASYRDRIRDVLAHRAGPRYDGLMNGFGRELNLTYYDTALHVRAKDDPTYGHRLSDVEIWLTSSYFYVTEPRLYADREYAEIAGHTWKVTPKYGPAIMGLDIEQPIGHKIPTSDYVYEDSYIQFKTPKYLGAPVYLSYRYATRVGTTGKTVSQIVTELNALTAPNGEFLLDVTLDDQLAGTERATGLQRFPPTRLESPPYRTAGRGSFTYFPIRWMEVELYHFLEDDFIERFRNQHNSLFGTRYEGWAMQIKHQMHTTWGFLVADKNIWTHPKLRTSGIGNLPTNWDSYQGGWISTSGGPVYTTREAWPRRFKDQNDKSHLAVHGLPHLLMFSGIGDSWDLLFAVDEVAPSSPAGDGSITYFVRESSVSADLGLGTDGADSDSEVS